MLLASSSVFVCEKSWLYFNPSSTAIYTSETYCIVKREEENKSVNATLN